MQVSSGMLNIQANVVHLHDITEKHSCQQIEIIGIDIKKVQKILPNPVKYTVVILYGM